MKALNIHLKTVALIYYLLNGVIGNAQSCNITVSANGGNNGYANFYAAPTITNTTGTYYWDFGNGTTYSLVNQGSANGTYTANGIYTVSVVFVNTANTCSSVASVTINIFNVSCGLSASYTSSTSASTTSFTSTSTGTTGTTTYSWDYGDGNSGTGQQSTHTYTADGNYYPILYINDTSPQVCSSSISNYVGICTQTANFTSINYSNGVVGFTLSTPAPTVYLSWDLGDGTLLSTPYFNSTSFTHTYALNGSYLVQLLYSFGSCSITAQNTINVSNITNPCAIDADFSYSTGANTAINFLNMTTATSPSVTYSWNFGDGNTSTATAPSHTYATPGTYTVTLVADNNYSYTCTDTRTYEIVVNNCTFAPTFTSSVGANGIVTFTSSAINTNSYVTSWYYGDGGSDYYIGNYIAPSHNYANGMYTATLVSILYYTTGGFCTSTVTGAVTVTTNCLADAGFSMSSTGVPQNWTITVNDGPNIANATWDWGDGSTSNTLYTSHTYSASGYYTICLTVTNTCGATATNCLGYNIYRPANGADGSIISVTVIDLATVGIKNTDTDVAAFTISPNPNNGIFSLSLAGAIKETVSVKIYNTVGQIVHATEATLTNGNVTKEIHLDNIADGVYFIKINADGQLLTKKIVISKN